MMRSVKVAVMMMVVMMMMTCVAHGQSGVPVCPDETKFNTTLNEMLIASGDMPAQVVSVTAAIPLDVLFGYVKLGKFIDWNPLFNTISPPTSIELCGPVNAVYNNAQFLLPILPKEPLNGPHHIAEYGCSSDGKTCQFGWFFTLELASSNTLVTYGRHTFTFADDGSGNTIVTSWEKAAGSNVADNSIPWTNALQESLLDAVSGILCLERVYQAHSQLDPDVVAGFCTHFIP